jgi:crossover junction endodeoxyribonuclease RuvC
MIILGIDPGLSGAFAFLDTLDFTVRIEDMPTVEVLRNGKRKNEVNPAQVANIIAGRGVNMCWMERVNAMPGQGVTSVFSFGRSTGILEGVLAAYDIQTTIVTPQAWQKATAVRDGKDAGRLRAAQLFPHSSNMFARKKDNGRSDAALIAWFGSQSYKG